MKEVGKGFSYGKIATILLISAIFTLLAIPAIAGKQEAKEDGKRLIVVFENELINQTEKDGILKKSGYAKVKDLPLINATVVQAVYAESDNLRQNLASGILRVENDAVVRVQGKLTRPAKNFSTEILPWGVDRIDAERVWDRNNNLVVDPRSNAGDGVRVAVMDTGVDLDHPDLKKNLKKGYNAVDPENKPYDAFGHGTHVAGTIAAEDNRIGAIGVAPKAWLYPVKVIGDDGYGYISDVIEALEWCMQHKINVINMSFATSEDIQSMHDAIIAASDSGIVIVAAAGNEGPGDDTVQYPAKYPEVIAVSATDNTDAITEWSSRGPEVELSAPGADIYSTFLDGGYISGDGTSMATPHVTGTVALILASGIHHHIKSGPINEVVREILQSTSEDLGDPGKDILYGYGLVDAEKAAGFRERRKSDSVIEEDYNLSH